jgi:hypothetical protein
MNIFKSNNFTLLFFLLAFIEGGNVMVVEISGSNLLAPGFGNTIQLWSAVLGASLAGLATGYYTGGVLSQKNPNKALLYTVAALVLLNLLIPVTVKMLNPMILPMGVKAGLLLESILIILPILTCCGMISPLVIRAISHEKTKVGLNAGNIFFVSTFGGIFFTFLTGLYIIPEIGIDASFYCMSVLQVCCVGIVLVTKKQVQVAKS